MNKVKIAKEYSTIKKFCELKNIDSDILKNNPPKPDYMLNINGSKIGIEISEYIDKDFRQEYFIKKDICDWVENELNSNRSEYYKSSQIYWNNRNDAIVFGGRKNIIRIKEELFKIIDKLALDNKSTVSYETAYLNPKTFKYTENKVLLKYIDKIVIRRLDVTYNQNKVKFGESRFIGVKESIISKILKSKNKKYENYNNYFKINWLLIPIFGEWFYNVINSSGLEEYCLSSKVKSPFDKIYFVDFSENKIHELPTEKA